MTKFTSIALSAALVSLRHGRVAVAATGGCYPTYSSGTYAPGAMVSHASKTTSIRENFECKNVWCSNVGYAPGSTHGGEAWMSRGECNPNEPTPDPIVPDEWDLDGCPAVYTAGADYEEGDAVSVQLGSFKIVYTCKPFPDSLFCGQSGYEPGTSLHWKNSWVEQGSCSGRLEPTISPAFELLEDLGACPKEWESGREYPMEGHYKEGDTISVNNIVFACRGWPFSNHCGQAGYIPFNKDASTAGAWNDAWQAVGNCNGSMGPTVSPSFDIEGNIGACPDGWILGGDEGKGYGEGDLVAVAISAEPERKVAYRCKAWPFNRHCGQFKPTEYGGELGWEFAGSCDGTLSPTPPPTYYEGDCFYIKCKTFSCYPGTDGCSCLEGAPSGSHCTKRTCTETRVKVYSPSTMYEAGDVIHVAGERFKCKPHPFTGWCSIDTYEPELEINEFWPSAWVRDGKCPPPPPTLAPTNAPTNSPTKAPTTAPTTAPTASPTAAPTTAHPTAAPTTATPTTPPTTSPTAAPTTAAPTTPYPTYGGTPGFSPVC